MEPLPPPPSPSPSPAHAQRSRSPALSLPVPGAPSASLALYKARLRAAFAGANPRVCTAFFLFGEPRSESEPERPSPPRAPADGARQA